MEGAPNKEPTQGLAARLLMTVKGLRGSFSSPDPEPSPEVVELIDAAREVARFDAGGGQRRINRLRHALDAVDATPDMSGAKQKQEGAHVR